MSKDSEIYVEILGKLFSVLVDTGAQATVISQSLAEEYQQATGEKSEQWNHKSEILLPNGKKMKIEAQIPLVFCIGGEKFRFKAIIVPELQTKFVLGRDFLQKFGAQIDYEHSKIIFYPSVSFKVQSFSTTKAKEHNIISVEIMGETEFGTLLSIPAQTHSSGVQLIEGIVEVNDSQVGIGIYNPLSDDVELKAGEILGIGTPIVQTNESDSTSQLWNMYIPEVFKCDSQQDCKQESSEMNRICQTEEAQSGLRNRNEKLNEANKSKEPVQLDLTDTQMNEEQKSQMIELVQEYRDIFVGSEGVIGNTDLLQHHIRTLEGANPIASRPYRVDYKSRKVIEEQVADMLDKDVIQPSVSPWSAPVVLVPKPDGSLRFCVNKEG